MLTATSRTTKLPIPIARAYSIAFRIARAHNPCGPLKHQLTVDEIAQELVTHYWLNSAKRYNPLRSPAPESHAWHAMRGRLSDLRRYHSAQKRQPTLANGKSSDFLMLPFLDEVASCEGSTPPMAQLIDLRRSLDESGQAWSDLLTSLADGDTYTRQIRIAVAMDALRGRKHVPATETKPSETQFPACHALGDFPEGYDVNDVLCQNCTVKFECLPEARKMKLTDTPLDADTEVAAVLRGLVTVDQMVERQYTRARLLEGNHEVPPSMQHNAPDVLYVPVIPVPEEPAPGPEPLPGGVEVVVEIRKAKRPPKNAPQCVDPANLTVDTKNGVFFYGLQIANLGKSPEGWGWFSADCANESDGWYEKKAACLADLRAADCTTRIIELAAKDDFPFAKKPSKKPAPAPAAPPRPTGDDPGAEGWPQTSGSRACPVPKPFKNAAHRESIFDKLYKSLGSEIRLAVGQRIIRRQRNGKECVVEVRSKGFAYHVGEQTAEACGFDSPVQLFRSLSAVAQWHTRRQTSGNAYFHLEKTQTCIEDAHGNILDGRGGAS